MTTALPDSRVTPSREAVGIGCDALVRPFAMGELWAGSDGMKCEYPGCTRRTCMIYLTDAEDASLPEPSGPHACLKIFNDHLGKVLCDQHGPNRQ